MAAPRPVDRSRSVTQLSIAAWAGCASPTAWGALGGQFRRRRMGGEEPGGGDLGRPRSRRPGRPALLHHGVREWTTQYEVFQKGGAAYTEIREADTAFREIDRVRDICFRQKRKRGFTGESRGSSPTATRNATRFRPIASSCSPARWSSWPVWIFRRPIERLYWPAYGWQLARKRRARALTKPRR